MPTGLEAMRMRIEDECDSRLAADDAMRCDAMRVQYMGR